MLQILRETCLTDIELTAQWREWIIWINRWQGLMSTTGSSTLPLYYVDSIVLLYKTNATKEKLGESLQLHGFSSWEFALFHSNTTKDTIFMDISMWISIVYYNYNAHHLQAHRGWRKGSPRFDWPGQAATVRAGGFWRGDAIAARRRAVPLQAELAGTLGLTRPPAASCATVTESPAACIYAIIYVMLIPNFDKELYV